PSFGRGPPRKTRGRWPRGRPTPSTGASSRSWPSARRPPPSPCRRSADAAPSPCGAIRYGCFSGFGSCSLPAPRSSPRGSLGSSRRGRACSLFAIVFAASYSVLPAIDHRYRAVFYPGDRLADELARRFRAATGAPLVYVIGTMWDGGNVAHYAREQPRVLIDGDRRRAPWIDVGDLRSKGAVVVGPGSDPTVMPVGLRGIAGDAQIQPPFTLPFRRGDHVLTVGWAILRPQPAFARAD